MPEGPEVKAIKDVLESLEGKTLVRVTSQKEIEGMKNEFLPLKITKVWSYGKRIIFNFTTADGQLLHFFIFLGMTGKFLFPSAEVKKRYTRIEFELGQFIRSDSTDFFIVEEKFTFDDQRSFG